jgi:hypothetical protein
LRVKVNQQNRLANGGQRGAEIDRRGGFAYTAFLIGQTHDARRGRRCSIMGG